MSKLVTFLYQKNLNTLPVGDDEWSERAYKYPIYDGFFESIAIYAIHNEMCMLYSIIDLMCPDDYGWCWQGRSDVASAAYPFLTRLRTQIYEARYGQT